MNHNSKTLKAIGLVLLAMAIMPLIDVIAKYLGRQNLPIMELVWARFFFGTLVTLPFAYASVGIEAFRPSSPILNSIRATSLILGTFCFFFSLKFLPIADTLSIFFVQPLLITALSPFFLGEHVDGKRWSVVFLGFIGVLIIIRPGIQTLNLGHLFAFLAGCCSACYYLITRKLKGKANPLLNTFQTSAIGAIALSLITPLFWNSPSISQWALFLCLGAIAIVGHYLVTKAYDYAEASLLSPLNYSEMITSVLLGWLFFGDFPDQYTFMGVAILIACAIYISNNERQLAHANSSFQTKTGD